MGTVFEIPAISAAVIALSHLGLGDRVPAMATVRTTAVFASLPALLTAAGVGRLAAHQSVLMRRRWAVGKAAGAHALAGAMLTLIAALPHGGLPMSVAGWAALLAIGGLAGAFCGAIVGVACTGATPRQVTDVLSLVKRPGTTLRQIIDSEDLGRLGAAVRQRASLVFDGLLDPAAPRPSTETGELGGGDASAAKVSAAEEPAPEAGAGARAASAAEEPAPSAEPTP